MKALFSLVISFLFGLSAQADDIVQLKKQCDAVKHELGEIGYLKWKDIQVEYVKQSQVVMELKTNYLKARQHRLKTQLDRKRLMARRREALQKLALENPEKAKKMADAAYKESLKFEKTIDKLFHNETKALMMQKRHVTLLSGLEDLEKKYTKKVLDKKPQVDQLLAQWKELKSKIEEAKPKPVQVK